MLIEQRHCFVIAFVKYCAVLCIFAYILNAFFKNIGHNMCTGAVYRRDAMLHMFVEFWRAC